ncbi:MAG: hypothetical protein C7B45_15335 [Sulfobacillus acidophilus]|uniref:ATP-binding protein n=1 Tax=Sulfobacillus acidophilus TaxID=53633 RepID=A0A2T2WDP9_9FIRM|nr:MAG: hypothetical protein C7B45_15335 [Sulfobacillus acidophilus]
MGRAADWTPWREVVTLRDDVKTGDLSLARFAADLYDVVLDQGPVQYRDPEAFFSLTYPTFNLRELVKDVMLRLAGQSEKAIRQLELTYGGGKTHTLITLYQLAHDPAHLPDVPAVHEFQEHAGVPFTAARIACLPFDKLDVEKGMDIADPQGRRRWLKQPWSVLAYQIAGDKGLQLLHADGRAEERESAPAENLLVDLLRLPAQEDQATLILMDEVLMYVREKVALDPTWRGRMQNFFQYLTQAVTKVPRCALVVSLIASDPGKNDTLGKELSLDLAEVFRREQEHSIQPVGKEDVAEILRRQFFTVDSIRDRERFRAPVVAALKGISGLDDSTRKEGGHAEARYIAHYPFHPELTDVLYTKWTQMEGFQRTRGILRTFALALRDAYGWDNQSLISTNVFLADPASPELSAATRDLATVAASEEYEGKRQEWLTILQGELQKAKKIQEEYPALRGREIEQAVLATFLHSQPIGQRASTRDIVVLLGAARPDRIELEKGLRRWADLSWFLDETALADRTSTSLPAWWRLGSRPNLKQMHNDARLRVSTNGDLVMARLLEEIKKVKSLTIGANSAGAAVHMLPKRPADIEDDGAFHYAVLGPEAASTSGTPSALATRFLQETTTSDRPRVHRNAVVLATLDRGGLAAFKEQVEVAMAWEEVERQLAFREVDATRQHLLHTYQKDANEAIADLVKQSYAVVVTVGKDGTPLAFKMTVDTTRPLFEQIKNDPRSRIQDTAISADAILPGGPYELWKSGDTARRLKDLVGAFADVPALPKMLRSQGIWDTVSQGMQEGRLVLRAWRPDRTFRTWWHEPIRVEDLGDPSLEVVLPESGVLDHLDHNLLSPGRLPDLWSVNGELTMGALLDYFGGQTMVQIEHQGYSEAFAIPKLEAGPLQQAVTDAVKSGLVWVVNGGVSVWQEEVPDGLLTRSARLNPPPTALSLFDLLPDRVPEAWQDGKTTALALVVALSNAQGVPLPWPLIRHVITEARNNGLIQLELNGISWPCGRGDAEQVRIVLNDTKGPIGPGEAPTPPDRHLRSDRVLKPAEIQNLADVIGELARLLQPWTPTIQVMLDIDTTRVPMDPDVKAKVNALLSQVTKGWNI